MNTLKKAIYSTFISLSMLAFSPNNVYSKDKDKFPIYSFFTSRTDENHNGSYEIEEYKNLERIGGILSPRKAGLDEDVYIRSSKKNIRAQLKRKKGKNIYLEDISSSPDEAIFKIPETGEGKYDLLIGKGTKYSIGRVIRE